ncbi:MAG: aldo/keto reductase family oxidoreductase [Actinomycetota bacterium]
MTLVDRTPRRIGDLQPVGPLAFGTWRFTNTDLAHRRDLVAAALDHGLNLFDTADVYGLDWNGSGFGSVESALGEVLARDPGLRARIVLATKGGIRPPTPYDSSPEWIRRACEDSLRRLGVDHVDIYQIHRPDLFAHPAEVAGILTDLYNEGKIRYVGVTNFDSRQFEALAAHLPFPIVSSQFQFSVVDLEPLRDGTFDTVLKNGVQSMAWSPLAGGRVATGRDIPVGLIECLDRLAEREGVDRATVALAFVLAHPSRPIAILGSQQTERIAAATRALSIRLDRADVYAVVQESDGRPLP